VPGVTLTKWLRVWNERHPETPLRIVPIEAQDPLAPLRDETVDVVFARLPVDAGDLHVIPLYEEQPVVVLPREHALADRAEVDVAALADETRLDWLVCTPARVSSRDP
jgi:DNA-binding transcriptional LysR family regulator